MATARSINVHLRVKPREAKQWRAAAKRADATLSEWLRNLANVASAPAPTPSTSTVSAGHLAVRNVKP